MSSQLQSNSSVIDELITIASSLPDAGSGSGGSTTVDTCTVQITHSSFSGAVNYLATCYSDGEVYTVSSYVSTYYGEETITINNVICGSTMALSFAYYVDGATSLCEMTNLSGGVSGIYLYQITASAGETVSFGCV